MTDQWESRPTSGSDQQEATRVDVLRLKPGGKATAILLGDIFGRWLHWDDGSQPCSGQGCQRCADGKRRYRRWYGPGLHRRTSSAWQKVVIELTDENEEELRGQDLVGLVIELSRAATPKSHLVVQLGRQEPMTEAKREKALAMAFDVKPILERLWRGGRPAPVSTENPNVIPFKRGVG